MKTATLLLGFLAALPLAALGQDEIRVIVGFNGRPDRATFGRHGGSTVAEGSGYEAWNGTSMATPHVAGAAALVWASPCGRSASSVRSRLVGKRDSAASRASSTANLP